MVLCYRGQLHEAEANWAGRLTRGYPTNYTNTDAASDSGQKAAPDTGHLIDAREVGEGQPLHTKVR